MSADPHDGRPKVLTRRRLEARLRSRQPAWPAELIRAAEAEIILALAEALAEGRPVVLNGFGRFEARRYPGPRKKLGLVFRPGARLRDRLNPRIKDAARAAVSGRSG